jgi:hypothetical protein
VGTPFEDWANATLSDTGAVVMIPGSADGLVPAGALIQWFVRGSEH